MMFAIRRQTLKRPVPVKASPLKGLEECIVGIKAYRITRLARPGYVVIR